MRQLASVLLAVAALSAAAAPARAQQQQKPQPPMRDYEYSFRVIGSHDEHPMSGTMRVSGDRGRIDIDGAKEGEFMLLTDGGRTLTIVHPERRAYEVSDAATFEHIVGRALRAVPVLSIQLESAHVASDHLGDGGLVVGRATRHLRLTQDYTVRVGALGFGGDPERHVATTEYWVSPGLALMRNPLFALVEGAESALVQSDTAYSRIADAERDALLEGATPLRRVVTTREEHGGKTTTQTIEITSLRPARVDPAIFQLPSGYTRRAGVSWLSSR